MNIEPYILWNIILTLVIVPMGWYITRQDSEVKRLQILLNITREEYLKRGEHSEETERLLEHLRRLEDKIDRIALHTNGHGR
jgi:uncharacterized membrane protein